MPENTIHYLWIGPPTKYDPMAVAGHDVCGPVNMARQLARQAKEAAPANAIKFWCLRQHEPVYKEQFRQLGVEEYVRICTIEDLLEKTQGEDGPLSEHAVFLSNKLIELSANASVRDRVAFKDNFSFFLLASQAGYFFDTNVFPIEDATIALPADTTTWTARGPHSSGSHDFYLMYTPSVCRQEVLDTLDSYRKPLSKKMFDNFDKPRSHKTIQEMGIEKVSYKSYNHTSGARGLFYWLNSKKFQEMLDYADINLQIAYPDSVAMLAEIDFYNADGPVLNPHLPHISRQNDLLTLPFPNQRAYILWQKQRYYVDKSLKSITPLPPLSCQDPFFRDPYGVGLLTDIPHNKVQDFVSHVITTAKTAEAPTPPMSAMLY